MSYLKEADRKRLIDSVDYFISLLDKNSFHNDPIKAAEEAIKKYELSPNLIQVFCHAINHGQFAEQLEKCGNDTSCRLSPFKLLIPELLIERLYSPEKSAEQEAEEHINNYWDRLIKEGRDMPSFLRQDRPKKVKEIYKALKRDHPNMPAEQKARIAHAVFNKMKHKHHNKRAEEAEYQEYRERARSAKDQFVSALINLSHYFQLVPEYRVKFSECEKAAELIWGKEVVKPIFDFVWEKLGKQFQKIEKRADEKTIITFSTDTTQEPLNLVEKVIKSAYLAINKYIELQKNTSHKTEKTAKTKDTDNNHKPKLNFFNKKPTIKLADIPSFPSIAKDLVDFEPDTKIKTKKVIETISAIRDPELDALKSGVFIKQIINNDPVISEYSDAQIEEALNEVVQSIPQIIHVPSLLRSTLRKRLAAGVLEPFEIKEISDAINRMVKAKTDYVNSIEKQLGVLQNVVP